ncbi:caspase domain-containing protein [Daedaleopsis nitida]|nr:caspase domain-containing protein [Daedaleopsis nitida]
MTVLSKLARSSTSNSTKPKAGARKPVRRALLIGITYKGTDGPRLRMPHKDARDLRDLLLDKDKYGFLESEITLMLDDDDVPSHLVPSRENILREIQALVKGALAGDRFMFYYAGHSDQIPTLSMDEEDGLNETILPYHAPGQEPTLIIDDELRDMLVDPLPIGSSLTAIFDSCHSGTLLDLDHYLCNRVWFPWRNRGGRDLASERRRGMLRRNDDKYDMGVVKTVKLDLKLVDTASVVSTDDAHEPQIHQPAPKKPSVRIYERERKSTDKMYKRTTVVDDLPPTEHERRRFKVTRSSTLEATRRGSFNMEARKPRRVFSFHNFTFTGFVGIFRRCSSPESILPCTGWCEAGNKKTKAHVVSISACQDPQKTWETGKGRTMTQSLISILRKTVLIYYGEKAAYNERELWRAPVDRDPHPPYRELIKAMGHDLHKNTTLKLHRWSERQVRQWVDSGSPVDQLPNVEVVNGSEPSLGSLEPLRPDEHFNP